MISARVTQGLNSLVSNPSNGSYRHFQLGQYVYLQRKRVCRSSPRDDTAQAKAVTVSVVAVLISHGTSSNYFCTLEDKKQRAENTLDSALNGQLKHSSGPVRTNASQLIQPKPHGTLRLLTNVFVQVRPPQSLFAQAFIGLERRSRPISRLKSCSSWPEQQSSSGECSWRARQPILGFELSQI